MLPASFVLLERLPLSPNGKVNRRALPAPDPGRPELAAAYVAPRTKVEQTITAIWKEALQLEKVGMHDNFFDLGGHSLLMAQVQKKLEGAFHTNVSLVDLFQYPNIDALARHMSQEGELLASWQDDEQGEKLKAGRSRLQQRLTQRQRAAKEGRI
jgi:acyl carrier protein